MRHAPIRSDRHLRPLRPRLVRRLHQAFGGATPGLLGTMRDGVDPGRSGNGLDPSEKPPKRPGQRVLLLPVRRAFDGGRGRRVVLYAGAVFDLVHRRLQCGFHRVGNLVWADCAETDRLSRTDQFPISHYRRNVRRCEKGPTNFSAIQAEWPESDMDAAGAAAGGLFLRASLARSAAACCRCRQSPQMPWVVGVSKPIFMNFSSGIHSLL